jgi:preprotein translocase subunit SecG
METLIILLHILIAVAIIAFVLLQQGKGAEAGASFGAGASQTLFGSTGTWNFFSRLTAVLALLFFLSSFALAVIARNKAGGGQELTPELRLLHEQAAGDGDIPDLDSGDAAVPGEIPEAGTSAPQDAEIPVLELPRDAVPEEQP